MLNRIVLMGRLTRDPELRRTGSRHRRDHLLPGRRPGLQVPETARRRRISFDVVAWRATAEFVSKYFTKGRMAVVEGRLQIRDWTDRDGGKRAQRRGRSRTTSTLGIPSGTAAGDYRLRARLRRPCRLRLVQSRARRGGQSDFAEIGEEDGELPF